MTDAANNRAAAGVAASHGPPPGAGGQAVHPYFHGLDLIRFVAAVAVAIYHLDAAANGLSYTFWWGWVGVEMFFLLSGAVICNSAEGNGFRAFLTGRVLRLYPAAVACALINFAFLLARKAPENLDWIKLAASLTLVPKAGFLSISGDRLPNLGFLAGAYWTLPIEIAFYGLIAVAILAGQSRRLHFVAMGLGTVSGLYLIGLSLATFGAISIAWPEFGHGMMNLTLLRHGVIFAAGMLLARRVRHGLKRREAAFLIVFIALATLETLVAAAHPDHASAMTNGSWIGLAIPALVFLVTVVLVMVSMGGSKRLEQALARHHRLLRTLGLLTYPLYLIHQNVGATLAARTGDALSTPAFIVIGLAITISMAMLVALWAEPPMRSRLKAALGSPRTPSSARPAA